MSDLRTLLRQAAKPFLFLLTLIFICAFLAHYLTGDETLLEYARKNPEQAYGSQTDTDKMQTPGSLPSAEKDLSTKELTESDDSSHSETTPPSDLEEKGGINTADTVPSALVTSNKSSTYTDTKNSIADATDRPLTESDGNPAESAKESDLMTSHPNRTTYEDGFYYEPLTEQVKDRITGVSYPEDGCTVPYEDLNYVGLKYIDFDGQEQIGELICNKAIAQDMVEIFYELYRNDYRLERVRLIDEYNGDDTASMAENNTSCFNYRVVDGTTNLSKHAYGLAIDINPYYNPYVVFNRNADGSDYISPPGSEMYADRSRSFAYKIDENDLCYRLFTEHGFTWGGNWNSTKDYQHFQKTLE